MRQGLERNRKRDISERKGGREKDKKRDRGWRGGEG